MPTKKPKHKRKVYYKVRLRWKNNDFVETIETNNSLGARNAVKARFPGCQIRSIMRHKASSSEPIIKEAQSKRVISEKSISVHDIDRYRTDKYECYLSLLKTSTSYDVGFQINSSQLGVASNVEYWHYMLNELDQAKTTFSTALEKLSQIVDEFEKEKIPFALYGPKLRAAMKDIDPDHKDISGIYHINKNIKNPSAADWRETIYGPRYPKTPIIGNTIDGFFSQQKDYSVQTAENKSIGSSGEGRNKNYKYAYVAQERQALKKIAEKETESKGHTLLPWTCFGSACCRTCGKTVYVFNNEIYGTAISEPCHQTNCP